MTLNFCPNCGAKIDYQEAEICPKCGVRIKEPPKPQESPFAGFWIRFVANLIDSIILNLTLIVLLFVIIGFIGLSMPTSYSYYSLYSGAYAGAIILLLLLIFIIPWLYYAILESSVDQATIGKRVLGLKVVKEDGSRLSFGRASLRWLARLLSGLILGIGFIMIGFTDKKQGLHDMIASTLVIKK